MSDLFSVLSDVEIDVLNTFLLDRIDEDADTQGKDEGVLDITELDGLFTAIISGPVLIPPSRWLPAVWGDFEPVWESEGEFEKIFTLMMCHMNSIASLLTEHRSEFEPIFLEREVGGRKYAIVDEWCAGYKRGVDLAPEQWSAGGKEIAALLAPVYAFTEVTGWRGHDLNDDQLARLQQEIVPAVREIHAYWLARREQQSPQNSPVRRSEPRVGRNDPCPCGSGKKYKKCCLH